MRKRLSVSVEIAAARIDELVSRGEQILSDASAVEEDHGLWIPWTHALERWQASGKAALGTTFKATDEADEFFQAATSRIYRQVGQTDDQTFTYQREALGSALNTLRSLKEHLEGS